MKGKKIDRKKIKGMCRAGIPTEVRGDAWVVLSKSNLLDPIENVAGARTKYMKTLLKQKLSKEDLQIILKDVPRTISKPVSKQVALFHVLKCIVIQFPEVGYM